MEAVKKQITGSQVIAMVDFMKEHPDVAEGLIQPGEKNDIEAKWHELTEKLNAMGGSVKSIEQWKKTWSYLKYSNKKRGPHRAMRPRPPTDYSGMTSKRLCKPTQRSNDAKKQFVSFDQELVNIEKDKLKLEREYKLQKIDVLCRIAAALENLANKS